MYGVLVAEVEVDGRAGPGDDERSVGRHGHAGLVLHAGLLHAGNVLVHLELAGDGLALGVIAPRVDVRGVGRVLEPGPAPDQTTTKLPSASMATSGLPQEVEAVVLTVNSAPIVVAGGL